MVDRIIKSMKNISDWQPTKYILKNGQLRANRDSSHVNVSSRMFVDIIGSYYSRFLKTYTKGDLLDLGCGHVPLYDSYKDLATSITCIDWDNSLHKNPYLDMVVDLNQAIPLESDLFDTVILSDVLEHIRRPEELLNEINRVMKKDGALFLNVPFMYWLHEEPYDYYRYTKHALNSMLEEAGFTIEFIESMGGVPEVSTDIYVKTVKNIPVIGIPLAKFTQWWVSLFLKTGLGKKISRKTAEKFPIGYFAIAIKTSDFRYTVLLLPLASFF